MVSHALRKLKHRARIIAKEKGHTIATNLNWENFTDDNGAVISSYAYCLKCNRSVIVNFQKPGAHLTIEGSAITEDCSK